VDAQDESCLIQDTEHANSNQSFLFPPTAALSTAALGDDAGDKCFGADASGEAFLKVERFGSWAWTKELPVELLFATEPAADTKGLPDAYPAPLPPVLPAPAAAAPGDRGSELQHRRRAQARPVLRIAAGLRKPSSTRSYRPREASALKPLPDAVARWEDERVRPGRPEDPGPSRRFTPAVVAG
jgi:hypothetical protein